MCWHMQVPLGSAGPVYRGLLGQHADGHAWARRPGWVLTHTPVSVHVSLLEAPGTCTHVQLLICMCAQACVTGAGPSCDHRLTHTPACPPAWVKSSPVFSSLRSFASGGSWGLRIPLPGCLDWALVGDAVRLPGIVVGWGGVGGPGSSGPPSLHPLCYTLSDPHHRLE